MSAVERDGVEWRLFVVFVCLFGVLLLVAGVHVRVVSAFAEVRSDVFGSGGREVGGESANVEGADGPRRYGREERLSQHLQPRRRMRG
jgi:hypothetical protein